MDFEMLELLAQAKQRSSLTAQLIESQDIRSQMKPELTRESEFSRMTREMFDQGDYLKKHYGISLEENQRSASFALSLAALANPFGCGPLPTISGVSRHPPRSVTINATPMGSPSGPKSR